MVDQDTIHRQLAPLIDKGLVLRALEGGVAAAHDERLVAFEPADLQDVHFRALWAHVRDMPGHSALVELGLNAGHGWRSERYLVNYLFEREMGQPTRRSSSN